MQHFFYTTVMSWRKGYKILFWVFFLFIITLLLGTPMWAKSATTQHSSSVISDELQLKQAQQDLNRQAQTAPLSSTLSTPQLIEAARIRQEIDQETAMLYVAYALTDYEKLPDPYRSNVPWSGTLPLLHLKQALQTMQLSSRRTDIITMLEGQCDAYFPFPEITALHTTINTDNFHIQYEVLSGGLDILDYINALETAWIVQINQFGWARPPVFSGNPPPGNRYHVRIEILKGGLSGYVSSDGVHAGFVGDNPATAWNEQDAQATCMILPTDFALLSSTPLQSLNATVARELNYAIQFGYGTLTGANVPDDNFARGSAVWMEDEVFDEANINYAHLWPDFRMCMAEYTASPEPYWVTWRGLTERYGNSTSGGAEQVMQDFWEATSKSSSSTMLTAMDSALANKGTTLADAYHAYAIAAKFNKSCGGGYVYPYCFEEGSDYVNAAGTTSVHGAIATATGNHHGSLADNYALNWIGLAAGNVPNYNVTLQNTSSGGQLRGSVVCDNGSTLIVNPLPTVVGPGAATTLDIIPDGCNSIVAIVTNEAVTTDNPNSCTAHSYQLNSAGEIDLSLSSKVVNPDVAAVGQVVTFTVSLVNNGILSTTASLTDTMPATLALQNSPTTSSGPVPVVSGQTITWTGIITNGSIITITYAVLLTSTTTTPFVINSAQINDGANTIYIRQAFVNGHVLYLPLVIKKG